MVSIPPPRDSNVILGVVRPLTGTRVALGPGARLQVDLSRGSLWAGRSRLDPGNVLRDEVGSPFLVRSSYGKAAQGCKPQPFASSSFERLVCLSSPKREGGGGVTGMSSWPLKRVPWGSPLETCMTPAGLLLYPAIGWLFRTLVPALQAVP